MTSMEKRLHKELQLLQKEPPHGVKIDVDSIHRNMTEWIVDLEGAQESLYRGRSFSSYLNLVTDTHLIHPRPCAEGICQSLQLNVKVMFIGNNIPVHPHVYSNGHICLSILTDDWSPALSVTSVCLSIVSMLSSCTEKKRPPDNALYVKTCSKNPKKTRWFYHDDEV